jgi:hypothetical protein
MSAAAKIFPPELAARAVHNEVLKTQYDGAPAVRLDSPPGAGKTRVVEDVAIQSAGILRERCMIVTQTNWQAFDIARRLAMTNSRLPLFLFKRAGLELTTELINLVNRGRLVVIEQGVQIPRGASITIANAAKWSWVQGQIDPFDVQVIDESFQLPDYRFHQISGMASRHLTVGDPGQILPVVTCEIDRWKSDPAGPHVPCPRALVQRHPDIIRLALPVLAASSMTR